MIAKATYVQPSAEMEDIVPARDLFVTSPYYFGNEQLSDDESGEW